VRRILLAFLAFTLPQIAVAATCNILPYQNQCQGSNAWPTPSGWFSDGAAGDPSPGNCQGFTYRYVYNMGSQWYDSMTALMASSQLNAWNAPANPNSCGPAYCECDRNYNYAGPGTCMGGCSYMRSRSNGTCTPNSIAQYSVQIANGGAGRIEGTKPSDGVCTARWTTAAQTALQKDPLDPDCDANSCATNGVCELR
jgi:hypothetical protein